MLPKTLCFLLSGKAGVGKTFHADALEHLLTKARYKVKRESFARGVKEIAVLMGWNGAKDEKGRTLLQRIGQIGRDYDQDVWVRSTFKRILNSDDYPYDVVIIDDWRFKNEIDFINKQEPLYETVSVRIVSKKREILVGTPAYDDISEVDLDDFGFDYHIHNVEDGLGAVTSHLKYLSELEGIQY